MNQHRSRPPELNIPLFRNIGLLILMNIIPIGGLIYISVQVKRGVFSLRNQEVLPSLVQPFLLGMLLVLLFWVFLPTAKWMKQYTWWGFNNGNYIFWALPFCVTWAVWGLVMLLCLVGAGAMIVSSLNALVNIAGAVF